MKTHTVVVSGGKKSYHFRVKQKSHSLIYYTGAYIIWAALAFFTYPVSWIAFLLSLFMTISYAHNIFEGSSTYILHIPEAKQYQIYKLDTIHFVGTSYDEAVLFAETNNLDPSTLEIVTSEAYQYTNA